MVQPPKESKVKRISVLFGFLPDSFRRIGSYLLLDGKPYRITDTDPLRTAMDQGHWGIYLEPVCGEDDLLDALAMVVDEPKRRLRDQHESNAEGDWFYPERRVRLFSMFH